MRDVFPEARLLVHGLTLGVVDDGQVDLLEDSGQRTVCNEKDARLEAGEESVVTFIESAPASHPGGLTHQVLVLLRHTDRDDVGLEGDGFVEPEVVSVR